MAKAKRGLLLSLLTLLIAVAITATSTYAWFVVNTEVTASNMQVEVKSDTTYLVISSSEKLDTDVALSLTASNAKVLPVMYDQTDSSEGIKWKTNVGTAYDDGKAKNAKYTPVALDNLGKYYIKYTFYVGLTSTTAEAASNLRVKSMTVEKATNEGNDTFLPAVSAFVDCNVEGGAKIDYENISSIDADANGYSAKGALLPLLALNKSVQIDVYVYINGDNEVVKSSNAANLGAFKLSMNLEVTPAVA